MNTFPFFPVPEPGETVYSVLCRLIARSGLPSTYLLRELTGQPYRQTYLSALPGYLARMSGNIPDGNPWHDEALIVRKHTGLPYFIYFDPPGKREHLLKALAQNESPKSLVLSLGLTKYRCGAFPVHPRYCTSCAVQDRKIRGFAYYRREHQLPGVALCWIHGTPLVYGCTHCGPYPINGMAFSMPGKCQCADGVTPLPAHADLPSEKKHLLWLAQESAYMVNSAGTRCKNIREDLRALVLKQGFGRKSLLFASQLSEAIEKRFGREILEWLGAPVWTSGKPSPWLSRLFYDQRKRSPAICFILVIGTIFETLADFEKAVENSEKDIVSFHEDDANSPFPLGATSEFGQPPWSAELAHLLRASGCGLPGISKRLGVPIGQLIAEIRRRGWRVPLSQQTIKRLGPKTVEAIKKDLRRGMEKTKIMRYYSCTSWGLTLIELDDPRLDSVHRSAARQRTREGNRERLRQFLADNPTATRQDVLNSMSGLYSNLLRRDKSWFYQQIPQKNNAFTRSRKTISWSLLDQQKAQEIEKVIDEMLAVGKKPIWATKTTVLKQVNMHRRYCNGPGRFPEVTEVIQRRAETREAFIRRRLAWGIQQMVAGGIPLSFKKLYRLAVLPDHTVRKNKTLVMELAREFNATICPNSYFWES